MELTMSKMANLSEDSKPIAKSLLAINAVQLNTVKLFTWVSGIKSPIYCDNRKVNSHVNERTQVTISFEKLIHKQFPTVEVIAGVATGGISFGAMIANRMGLPFIYVRQEKKEHGLMKQVEGDFREGAKVVLIEDHISTGKSSMIAIDALRESKLNVLSIVSIMTYGFNKANKIFSDNKVKQFSLSDLDTILEVALKAGKIDLTERDSILEFRDRVGA